MIFLLACFSFLMKQAIKTDKNKTKQNFDAEQDLNYDISINCLFKYRNKIRHIFVVKH